MLCFHIQKSKKSSTLRVVMNNLRWSSDDAICTNDHPTEPTCAVRVITHTRSLYMEEIVFRCPHELSMHLPESAPRETFVDTWTVTKCTPYMVFYCHEQKETVSTRHTASTFGACHPVGLSAQMIVPRRACAHPRNLYHIIHNRSLIR